MPGQPPHPITPPPAAPPQAPPPAIHPTVLVMLAVISIQGGAAIAKTLFPLVGPFGTSALRVGFAAIILLLIWRPRTRQYTRADLRTVILFGLALGLMNITFYASIERIPLGLAVTLEFIGPLAVAILGSRRKLDGLWALLATLGILLIAPIGPASNLDPIGVLLALTAGAMWAAYILLGAHVGRAFTGGRGLALAMAVAALTALPFGVATAGTAMLLPIALAAGLGVAILSSALPYSLEMSALRRLPPRTFSILMSLEPAVAALMGYLILSEALTTQQIIAMLFVITASAGASLTVKK